MSATRKRRLPPIHARALNILKAYGANAHLYLPGVGAINGITAGNYLDSAGATTASVDQPAGLMLDAANSMLGPELVNTSVGAWGDGTAGLPTNTSFTQSGSSLTVTRGTGGTLGSPGQTIATVTGKTYRFSMTLTGSNGYTQPSNSTLVAGLNTFVFTATANNHTFTFWPFSTSTSFTVSDISVREIPGIHASQATTAAKPILRLNSGIYSAQFDGVDDYLSLGENTGTFGAIIAGAKPSSSGWFMVCGSGAQLPTNTGVRLGISGAAMSWMFETANGASAIQSQSPFAPVFSAPTVVGGRWTPTEQSLRINGISYGVTSSQVSASTQGFAIGAGRYASGSTGDFFPGHIYPVIVIKGTVSDADLLTLEKFVGSLSGVVV